MKKLMVAVLAAATMGAFAADDKVEENADLVKNEPPIFWGFGNYGIYSGYQLYGSQVHHDPTLQGYGEVNGNLSFDGWDLGYLGVGVWCNSDLTGVRANDKNSPLTRRAFNEFDFNIHWGRTFWFDDDHTWGLEYLTSLVWYWYPHSSHNYEVSATCDRATAQYTTFDWNHRFALKNPYLVPYVNVVHEYLKSNGNLLQFGLMKEIEGLFGVDGLTICPFVEGVWRNSNYGWCFSHYGQDENWDKIESGLATLKVELDATYMFTPNFGVFAKVAFCSVVDRNLRDAADIQGEGFFYGKDKDFVWGGAGVCLKF